jgi:hypothetical protein
LEHRFGIGPKVGVYASSPGGKKWIDCDLSGSLAREIRRQGPGGVAICRFAALERRGTALYPAGQDKLKLVYPVLARQQYPLQFDDQLILLLQLGN